MQYRVTDLCRNTLMTGKNLAVVLRYARKHPVNVVRIDHAVNVGRVGEYAVTFYFADRAECTTYWASWRVLLDWLCARRSWTITRVRNADTGPDIPYAHPALAELRAKGCQTVGFNADTV